MVFLLSSGHGGATRSVLVYILLINKSVEINTVTTHHELQIKFIFINNMCLYYLYLDRDPTSYNSKYEL